MPNRQEQPTDINYHLPTTQGQARLHHSPHNALILYPPHTTTTHRCPNIALERLPVLSQIVGGLLVQRIGSIRLEEEELNKAYKD